MWSLWQSRCLGRVSALRCAVARKWRLIATCARLQRPQAPDGSSTHLGREMMVLRCHTLEARWNRMWPRGRHGIGRQMMARDTIEFGTCEQCTAVVSRVAKSKSGTDLPRRFRARVLPRNSRGRLDHANSIEANFDKAPVLSINGV